MDSKTLLLTANTETVYAYVWLDTKSGPLVIDAPPGLLGLIDDFWFHYVTDIGAVGPDKGKGGKYLLLPPGRELLRCTVKAVQSSLGSKPQDTAPVFENRSDHVVRQAMWVRGVVVVRSETPGLAVPAVQARRRAHPEDPFAVFQQRKHTVTTQAGRVYTGGRTSVDGQDQADYVGNTRLGATYNISLRPRHSVKINFFNGFQTRIGNDTRGIGIAYNVVWQRGI